MLEKNRKNAQKLKDSISLQQFDVELGIAIGMECGRISEMFNGKSFLSMTDVEKLMGLGKDSVNELFHSKLFPVRTFGKRKLVSVMEFCIWQISQYNS